MKFAFKKRNYTLLFIGLFFIICGLLIMIGGESKNPEMFSYEIFNFQRLTIAPVMIAVGFVIQVFAIMYKQEDS